METKYNWNELLAEAIEKPGMVNEAYHAFYNYSLGNQLLALVQCKKREMPVGPLATYKGWQAKGRQVKKGEQAITLCFPLTKKVSKEVEQNGKIITQEYYVTYFFDFKAAWFTVHQTEGEEVLAFNVKEWDSLAALTNLDVKLVPFEHLNGNVLGYAKGKEIALNPTDDNPLCTMLHELAHIVLGHTKLGKDGLTVGNVVEIESKREIKEIEAETVAYLCMDALALDEERKAHARDYIQGWARHDKEAITEKMAERIFSAANKILEAGRNETKEAGKVAA